MVFQEKKGGEPNNLVTTTSYSQGEVSAVESGGPLRHTETKREIRPRHAQMIAIGGIIGTGLFVGSGQGLAISGAGSLLFAYCVLGVFVYFMITATTTVSAYLPIQGSSMAAYASRYVSKSLGFSTSWLYWYTFAMTVAYEITAASLVINYWPNDVHLAVWITIMYVVILGLNLSPVRAYAETEFWFASIKVLMIMGLLILSFIICVGGGPTHERIGFRYWETPGAWNTDLVEGNTGRFCAFIYALVFSMFSFAFGPELVVLTSGEMKSPRKSLPQAANTFIWRLSFFYILGSLAVGAICPGNAPGLTTGSKDAAASPWVIGIKQAGINGLDSVINAGIILSAWSSGNSFLYMSSRTLFSSAVSGSAPKIFARCTRNGVPVYATLMSAALGLLAFLNVGAGTSKVFNWMINLTNSAGFISWICCCIICVRFYHACETQGIKDIPYKSVFQPYASYFGMIFFTILLLLNGFSVFFPGHWDTSTFITSYIGIVIFLAIYVVHRYIHRNEPWYIQANDVDMTTGMDEVLAAEKAGKEEEKTEHGQKSMPRKIWDGLNR